MPDTNETNKIPDKVYKQNKDREKYFKSHKCSLTNFPSKKYDIECGRVRRFILDLTAVNFSDIRAKSMFRSFSSLSVEKHRQFTKYPMAIHPYSKLRLWAEIWVFANLLFMFLLEPIWLASRSPRDEDALHRIILLIHINYVTINMLINSLTGYVDGNNRQYIVLDKWKILKHYFKTWLIIDLMQLLRVINDLITDKLSYTHLIRIFDSIAAFEYLFLFEYHKNICTVFHVDVPSKTAMELVLFLTTFLSWNIEIQFIVEYFIEGTHAPVKPKNCSWLTVGDLWDKPDGLRLMYGLVRAVGMLRRNSNLNLLLYDGAFEVFTTASFIIAQCAILHCSFKYMLALFGTQSAKAKYYTMTQQIQTYMNQRRFPPRIKKKILKFYAIRFRSHFFVESTMLKCVSGQLHEDIIMHTGRHMVRNVTFLKQLPWAVLIEISLKFELAIFIEGDFIYKINTIGDRMYFINKGTVAFYTESGCEYLHLEDGEHFGEIALMSEDNHRFTTAVAVTNCELFSLSRENFEIIERYRTAYDELRKEGVNRRQAAFVVDEQFKAQLKEQKHTK